jgi:selenocysteine lyase/cysteine desulfurase
MGEADFVGHTRAVREACARLIGASPEEIALGANTSFGINLAAMGLKVPHGSIVVASDREFPANVFPWSHREHIRLEMVPTTAEGWPDIERILDRVRDPEVSILALSSVQFASGYKADLEVVAAVCRESGTLLVVDAIQSLGNHPIDVARLGIDVLACGGHKWLCGPLGVGFCYVRREVQDRLQPSEIGWSSMRSTQDFDDLLAYRWGFLPDARRYEVGTAPLQEYATLARSIELLLEVGVETIAAHVDTLLEPVRLWIARHPETRSMTPLDPGSRSAILAFTTPDTPATYRALQEAGVVSSLREGAIRLAPHLYNRSDDIERVVEVLEARRHSGWR